jgi:hypothetical protein
METLTQLNTYDAEKFAQWIGKQLKQIYTGTAEEKYRAFDFRQLGLSRGESHLDALHSLFRKLSADAQYRFKEALEQLLRNEKQDDFPEKAIADVVTLVGLTDARNAFRAFAPVLGSGPWGEMHPNLIYDALSVLMMFERSDDAYKAAKGLATSRFFPDSLVFDAYLVMVRSRPENWRDDFVLLRDRFSNVSRGVLNSADAGRLEQLQRRQQSFTQMVSATLPLSELGEWLATLNFAPPVSPDVISDDWLIDNMLQPGFGSIDLVWSEDINCIVVVDRANHARKAELKTTPSFEVAGIYHGRFAFPGNYDPSHYNKNHLSEKSATRLASALGTKRKSKEIKHINKKSAYAY